MSVLLSLTCLNISPPPAIAQPINCPEATVEGLQAEYFNNSHLTEPVLQRIDKTINFDWESGSPDSSIAPDTFSERWTGFITPKYSETYTFTTRSDDGVRLWINDQMIIDQWNYHPATNHSGSIELTAGQQYSIRIEHYEYGGMAVAQLYWSSPSQAQEIVPASQLSPNKIPESCNVEPGSISGVKWKDINGDGDRDKKLLQGDKPDVVFVIDVSQSAVQSDFAGSPVGDVNGSGNPNRILDAELAGFIALNEQLINQGLQDNARIGIVIFGAYGKTVDMDPSSPELQLVTTPGTDNNGNGTPDVEDILRSIKANNVTPYNLEVNGEK
ncbi:MAG: PA14 domain-containing protein, partial [Xenococcaceae cyanobacterium]